MDVDGVIDDGVIVAVDGGGSKTDAVALTLDGELVAHHRGPGSSPDFEGLADSVEIVDALVRAVAGARRVVHAGLYLSGLDLPIEMDRYRAALAGLPWVTPSTVVDNDLYALLRAGTNEADAVAIVCGTGVNGIGVRADGAQVRFPALGPISGDWGGGSGLGEQALWHAARDDDGRGPRTSLTPAILRHLGVGSIPELIEQLHLGDRDQSELTTLVPTIFAVAEQGDEVAQGIIDRQAEEIVSYARACLTRLDLLGRPVPIVLGGGVIRSNDPRLLGGIVGGLSALAPSARIEIFDGDPVVGAALLALADAGADDVSLNRARGALAAAVAVPSPDDGRRSDAQVTAADRIQDQARSWRVT